MNIVIMAGGGGTRLWPLSRQELPKQFLDLGSGKTLLAHTYERALQLTDAANIYVATTKQYEDRTRTELPDVAPERIFIEAERRDTGPAIAACAVQLDVAGHGDEPVIFMWSDHVFTNEEAFIADMQKIPGVVSAHPDHVVIIGHTPTSPETGLGYLELGTDKENGVHEVASFKEKPDLETAQEYVSAGTYAWNMAYVSTTPRYLLAQLEEHEPELASGLGAFRTAVEGSNAEGMASAYAELPSIAIDYALLEKTPRLLAVVGDYGWSDVGSWSAVQDVFGVDGDHMPKGHHVHVDSNNNYIYNATNRVVSLLGVKDTIVVVTDDAMLVTSKDGAANVKQVVEKLKEEGKSEYL